jgi:hypothetical protein
VNRIVFLPKPVQDDVIRTFDFTSLLDEGESLAAAQVKVQVFSGSDANPSGLLSGQPTIDGPRVEQKFTAGQLGTVYTATCLAGTCNGQVFSLAAYLSLQEAADD